MSITETIMKFFRAFLKLFGIYPSRAELKLMLKQSERYYILENKLTHDNFQALICWPHDINTELTQSFVQQLSSDRQTQSIAQAFLSDAGIKITPFDHTLAQVIQQLNDDDSLKLLTMSDETKDDEIGALTFNISDALLDELLRFFDYKKVSTLPRLTYPACTGGLFTPPPRTMNAIEEALQQPRAHHLSYQSFTCLQGIGAESYDAPSERLVLNDDAWLDQAHITLLADILGINDLHIGQTGIIIGDDDLPHLKKQCDAGKPYLCCYNTGAHWITIAVIKDPSQNQIKLLTVDSFANPNCTHYTVPKQAVSDAAQQKLNLLAGLRDTGHSIQELNEKHRATDHDCLQIGITPRELLLSKLCKLYPEADVIEIGSPDQAQTDGYRCGIFALASAKALSEADPSDLHKINSPDALGALVSQSQHDATSVSYQSLRDAMAQGYASHLAHFQPPTPDTSFYQDKVNELRECHPTDSSWPQSITRIIEKAIHLDPDNNTHNIHLTKLANMLSIANLATSQKESLKAELTSYFELCSNYAEWQVIQTFEFNPFSGTYGEMVEQNINTQLPPAKL